MNIFFLSRNHQSFNYLTLMKLVSCRKHRILAYFVLGSTFFCFLILGDLLANSQLNSGEALQKCFQCNKYFIEHLLHASMA